MNKEIEKAINAIKQLYDYNVYGVEDVDVDIAVSALERYQLLDKWGIGDLSIEELEKWHERVKWHVKRCDELGREKYQLADRWIPVTDGEYKITVKGGEVKDCQILKI